MRRSKCFYREKKLFSGEPQIAEYMDVDIIPRTEPVILKPGKRAKKERVSAPKQRNLNDKNAKRYFGLLANTNFGAEDFHISVTYSQKYKPDSIEAAEKEAANFLRRVAYQRKKQKLPPLKYLLVTEYSTGKDGEKPVRVHHHFFVNGGLDRDIIEDLWRKPRKKGQKKGDKLGYANADRLQPDDFGLEALARYLTKNPNGKKRWSSSQNLDRPQRRDNDSKYTKRQVERMAREDPGNIAYWMKQYPGWRLTQSRPEFNEVTGTWSIYLKFRRLE